MTGKRIIVLALLVILACCVFGCALAWVYQIKCAITAGTEWSTVTGGETAHFRLWHSDCLIAPFARACYLEPKVQVEGLPAGSGVSGVEWLNCHESDLIIETQPMVPPGVYPLTIRIQDTLAFPLHVTLEVVAP